MTQNGWCRTNYHKDGKRRFGRLTKDGLCCECEAELVNNSENPADQGKITRLEQTIVDLEIERDRLNSEIKRLRYKLQTLMNSFNKSGVNKLHKPDKSDRSDKSKKSDKSDKSDKLDKSEKSRTGIKSGVPN